ncbi:MAG: GNAT family N-acetyltransferase [Promethearchaeota archaeon]
MRKNVIEVVSTDQIREIEEIAARAWPAKHTQQLGGWLLRSTEGVTHRANSVLPLHEPPKGDIEKALKVVQEFYDKHKLPVQFQMTKASQPSNLDEVLESHGLKIEMHVIVQTANLNDVLMNEPEFGVVIMGEPWEDWYRAYCEYAEFDSARFRVRRDIISRISNDKACAAAIIDDKIIGVGMGVRNGLWVGLFSLVTQEKYRRQHVATSITQSLVSWAQSQGANKAYLQVSEPNKTAQQLYYSLGFEDAYTYWYRLAKE